MENKIIKLIEEKGPQIAETLKIATTEVYEKVLAYIRISGVIDIGQTVLICLFLIIYFFIVKRFFDKRFKNVDEYDKVMYWFVNVVLGFVAFLLIVMTVDFIGDGFLKICWPEFWLIKQILEGTNQ